MLTQLLDDNAGCQGFTAGAKSLIRLAVNLAPAQGDKHLTAMDFTLAIVKSTCMPAHSLIVKHCDMQDLLSILVHREKYISSSIEVCPGYRPKAESLLRQAIQRAAVRSSHNQVTTYDLLMACTHYCDVFQRTSQELRKVIEAYEKDYYFCSEIEPAKPFTVVTSIKADPISAAMTVTTADVSVTTADVSVALLTPVEPELSNALLKPTTSVFQEELSVLPAVIAAEFAKIDGLQDLKPKFNHLAIELFARAVKAGNGPKLCTGELLRHMLEMPLVREHIDELGFSSEKLQIAAIQHSVSEFNLMVPISGVNTAVLEAIKASAALAKDSDSGDINLENLLYALCNGVFSEFVMIMADANIGYMAFQLALKNRYPDSFPADWSAKVKTKPATPVSAVVATEVKTEPVVEKVLKPAVVNSSKLDYALHGLDTRVADSLKCWSTFVNRIEGLPYRLQFSENCVRILNTAMRSAESASSAMTSTRLLYGFLNSHLAWDETFSSLGFESAKITAAVDKSLAKESSDLTTRTKDSLTWALYEIVIRAVERVIVREERVQRKLRSNWEIESIELLLAMLDPATANEVSLTVLPNAGYKAKDFIEAILKVWPHYAFKSAEPTLAVAPAQLKIPELEKLTEEVTALKKQVADLVAANKRPSMPLIGTPKASTPIPISIPLAAEMRFTVFLEAFPAELAAYIRNDTEARRSLAISLNSVPKQVKLSAFCEAIFAITYETVKQGNYRCINTADLLEALINSPLGIDWCRRSSIDASKLKEALKGYCSNGFNAGYNAMYQDSKRSVTCSPDVIKVLKAAVQRASATNEVLVDFNNLLLQLLSTTPGTFCVVAVTEAGYDPKALIEKLYSLLTIPVAIADSAPPAIDQKEVKRIVKAWQSNGVYYNSAIKELWEAEPALASAVCDGMWKIEGCAISSICWPFWKKTIEDLRTAGEAFHKPKLPLTKPVDKNLVDKIVKKWIERGAYYYDEAIECLWIADRALADAVCTAMVEFKNCNADPSAAQGWEASVKAIRKKGEALYADKPVEEVNLAPESKSSSAEQDLVNDHVREWLSGCSYYNRTIEKLFCTNRTLALAVCKAVKEQVMAPGSVYSRTTWLDALNVVEERAKSLSVSEPAVDKLLVDEHVASWLSKGSCYDFTIEGLFRTCKPLAEAVCNEAKAKITALDSRWSKSVWLSAISVLQQQFKTTPVSKPAVEEKKESDHNNDCGCDLCLSF
jgi:hypothetical protein